MKILKLWIFLGYVIETDKKDKLEEGVEEKEEGHNSD